ncbi:MAG: nicotinamide mononucleotide transporter [Burkholderiales bacterium]
MAGIMTAITEPRAGLHWLSRLAQHKLQLLIFVCGVSGQLLVTHMNTTGFVFWLVANVLCLVESLRARFYGMAAMYIVYAASCLYSVWLWCGR